MKHLSPDGLTKDHRASVTNSGQQSQPITARGHKLLSMKLYYKANLLDMLPVRGQILQYEDENARVTTSARFNSRAQCT